MKYLIFGTIAVFLGSFLADEARLAWHKYQKLEYAKSSCQMSIVAQVNNYQCDYLRKKYNLTVY